MISELGWTVSEQGWLLGAFFMGYTVSQLPSSFLLRHFGAKTVLVAGLLWSSVFSLLTPFAAQRSFGLALVCRVMVGMAQGPEFPASSLLVRNWAPPSETSQSISVVCAGGYLGAFIALPLCGWLLVALGWRSIFFVAGGGGLVFAAWYAQFVGESPESDTRISPEERQHIRTSKAQSSPWLLEHEVSWMALTGEMLCCRAVWAQIFASACNNFGFYMLLGEMPTFLRTQLSFSQDRIDLLAPLPYVLMWIVTVASGYFADYLLANTELDRLAVRRLCLAISQLPTGAFLLAAAFTQWQIALACLVMATGCNGFFNCSVSANIIETGGRHSATLYALVNSFGQMPGIFGAPLVGALTEEFGYEVGFRVAFAICFACYVLGTAFFVNAASSSKLELGKPASWDDDVELSPTKP
eukprot:CAMPEP_0197629456 /NCGR_PEP_ID=MMETSP1338-20131121/7295_1 /TAXON_ID=43686 ORGANISM="Pelagodinium beii, Strain RCC1491" /NCGR_SAMPLE_ID=MMETSP1338 /ASSEMBLY_ACC=CAM_ASM_000754 /LENGTH=411 /DNA_ID=CAMNT_0043200495 /DNA_START=327 /DNA_END=1562 /DNA_ORIENTATION=+